MKFHMKLRIGITALFVATIFNISCNEIVNEMPPSVTPYVSDVGVDYATINWNNAGDQYTYSLGFSSDSLATFSSDFDTLFTDIVDTSYTINNLQSKTKYWVRVITVAGSNKPDNVSNMLGFITEQS